MKKALAKALMYSCTASSAVWFVLGFAYGVPEAYIAAILFAILSAIWWTTYDE